jgi:hypothetical protein
MLGRDTQWRQGDLLTDESAQLFGFVNSADSNKCAVVISHDCDLANDSETFVEVIMCSSVQTADAMVSNARNPRRLHLKFKSDADADLIVELRHIDRHQISKVDFANAGVKNGKFFLSLDEKRALKQWLAARYGRPAFPNAFENRLRTTVGKKSVEYHIAKILEPESSYLVALFFDLGEEKAIELSDGTPYFLSISVVYDATEGGPNARESAERVATRLRNLFEQAYGAPDSATDIALESCNAISDTLMTLADLRKVDQWRLEYISLREDTAGDFFPVGEMPS